MRNCYVYSYIDLIAFIPVTLGFLIPILLHQHLGIIAVSGFIGAVISGLIARYLASRIFKEQNEN